MKRLIVLAYIVVAINSAPRLHAEDTPESLENLGKAFLSQSQTDQDALVPAARFFGRAAALYDTAGNADKAVEMNSFLYWCKKKMNMDDIKSFVEGDDAKLAKRLEAIEKTVPKPDDAKLWMDRATAFEKNNPNESFLIAVRYFEVADRFKGSELSLKAQELSLAAMQKTTSSPTKKSAKEQETATSQPRAAPDAKALTEAEAGIRDIFKDEYAKTKPTDKEALSKKLAQQAEETRDDLASQYVLWRESAMLAAQAGEVHNAMSAIDTLSTHFVVDVAIQKKAVLTVAGVNNKDPELTKLITAYRTLLEKPEDSLANTIVGRSLCISDRSWEKALAHLAKGSDAPLKTLADKELSGGSTPEARIELADAWFDLAEKETVKPAKLAWYDRALIWYNAAAPDAKGLVKSKIEKRIAASTAASGEKPVAVAKVQTQGAKAATEAPTNAAIQPGSIKNAILTENTTIPLTSTPYRNAGILQTPLNDTSKRIEIDVEAGVEIIGGQIQLHRTGKLMLHGTEDRPIILRNVTITEDWGGWVEAKYVVFDKCEFKKMGTFFGFAGFSTRWKFTSCIFNKSGFSRMHQKEYGFDFRDCAFIGWTFPDIIYDNKDIRDAKQFDHANYLRKDWNHILHCLFLDCTITPVIFWIAEESNFYSTKFVPGEPYTSSSTELTVENYVSGAQGDLPNKAKDKPVVIKPVKTPFPKLSLPAQCPIPELTAKLKVIYGN